MFAQVDIDYCINQTCQNNGTCVDRLDGFHCVCQAGFEGVMCDTETDECASNPCMFNSTCQDLIAGFRYNLISQWFSVPFFYSHVCFPSLPFLVLYIFLFLPYVLCHFVPPVTPYPLWYPFPVRVLALFWPFNLILIIYCSRLVTI